jgi:hypothetical protein
MLGRGLSWWVVATFVVGCGEQRPEEEMFPTATGVGTSNASGIDGGDIGDDGDTGMKLDASGGATGPMGDGGDNSACPCQGVLDGIYVLNSNTPPSVWFFDPPANTFTEVGVLGCNPGAGWTANSMAIDRAGYAWVNYYDQIAETGRIYRAPLSDLQACEQLPYNNPGSWWLLGMGYAAVGESNDCDELFVYRSDRYFEYPNFGPGGAELGQYVEATSQIDVIGPTEFPVAELTGTGDGRLFAFAALGGNEASLINLDKNTGAKIEEIELGIDITNAFAFAFWGGDVYFFTETAPLSGVSKVTRLDYDLDEGGGLSVYNANTGIHIPGAGVSTCASFVPPA